MAPFLSPAAKAKAKAMAGTKTNPVVDKNFKFFHQMEERSTSFHPTTKRKVSAAAAVAAGGGAAAAGGGNGVDATTASVTILSNKNDNKELRNNTMVDYYDDWVESTTNNSSNNLNANEEEGPDNEVQKITKNETRLIRVWRLLMTVALLLTAIAVTVTTFVLLEDEQEDNFNTAYDQFSRTVVNAVLNQQRDIRNAMRAMAETIEVDAALQQEELNMTSDSSIFPFYRMRYYENEAHHLRVQSGSEILSFAILVPHHQKDAYLDFVTANYEAMTKECHWIDAGNLDRLMRTDNYHPFMNEKIGIDDDSVVPVTEVRDYYVPTWQYSPPPMSYGLINWDFRSVPTYDRIIRAIQILSNETLFTRVQPYQSSIGLAFSAEEHQAMHGKLADSKESHPHSFAFRAIHQRLRDNDSPVVAVIVAAIAWDFALINLLPDGVNINLVIDNNCNQTHTWTIDGPVPIYMGPGDLHNPKFNYKRLTMELYSESNPHPLFKTTPGHCQYFVHVYPTQTFADEYDKKTPRVFAVTVAATFVLVAIIFVLYDVFVQKRNFKIQNAAEQSNAIVTSMFPRSIRERLVSEAALRLSQRSSKSGSFRTSSKRKLRTLALEGDFSSSNKPLADLFLDTSVIFADIAGFTAWSSVREPHLVFTLLETLYSAFDALANRRKIFKVETVGDCYVAVSGLPDPRRDHAVCLAKFARDLMVCMTNLTSQLVVTLGPDTGDLALRIGIHSGPVTAGVLRGERARFQLFGDTMNTASRMESTGFPGKIQVSHVTARILMEDGKSHWLTKRTDTVMVKGKGEMETYFLFVSDYNEEQALQQLLRIDSRVGENAPWSSAISERQSTERTERLIEWNTEVLAGLLRSIAAWRQAKRKAARTPFSSDRILDETKEIKKKESFLDEVEEIIELPEFDVAASRIAQNPKEVRLSKTVMEQLRHFVSTIAKMYRDNPFHNFEHASHVVMSVNKLMSRIVAPSEREFEGGDISNTVRTIEKTGEGLKGKHRQMSIQQTVAATLHDHTYGITSDPLTQFSCALSALIHDVDHTGVPNTQLIKENDALAALYKNRSVAEQNSLDLAWKLLMDKQYKELRAAIYSSGEELLRFRRLLVNSVMATDIADKELKKLRNARWDKAFSGDATTMSDGSKKVDVDRKATIVIEHLIQASDVAHTMQHWHIYRKWNERLFTEMYKAYKEGRAEKDPSEFWYKGEIGFFDFYIIPLAKKLKECGVFGVSSDEYLNYATQNRQEWESRGQEVVSSMKEKFEPTDSTRSSFNEQNRFDNEMQVTSETTNEGIEAIPCVDNVDDAEMKKDNATEEEKEEITDAKYMVVRENR